MPADTIISHAFVLPDRNFHEWLAALRPYLAKFERVAVVRSPAGANLNRYRNVTAVDAPLTWWQESALTHIRRVYPSVVMVDVIDVDAPEALSPIVRRRVANNDRYGELEREPQHIFQRFALEWPTSARPMATLARFNADEEVGALHRSLDILTHEDAEILCAAAGKVIAVGDGIQVESTVDGEPWITTYDGVKRRHVALGDELETGQVMAKAAGGELRLTVQQPPAGGISLLGWDNVMNPRDYIYIPQLRVRPLADNLRVRKLPGANASIVGHVFSWHLLEPQEHHGRAIEKIGVDGSWLKVRSVSGIEGYAAARYLRATTLQEGREAFPRVNPIGVNLDIFHPLGKPAADRLGAMGWVRFGYNVSNLRGSEDIEAAFNRYLPHVEAYRKAGYRVVFTTSHQTYGEGKAEFWPWSQMTDAKWQVLIGRFADMMEGIAAQWARRGLGRRLADLERARFIERGGVGAAASQKLRHHVRPGLPRHPQRGQRRPGHHRRLQQRAAAGQRLCPRDAGGDAGGHSARWPGFSSLRARRQWPSALRDVRAYRRIRLGLQRGAAG